MSPGPRVIVVGAGIAGLAAAFRLQQAGCTVLILERSGPELVGGRMATVERGGFPIDVGATLLLSSYTAMLTLAADAGAADLIRPAGTTYGLVRDGEVQRFRSDSVGSAVTSTFLRGLAKRDLAKIAADFLRIRPHLGWDDMTRTAGLDFETVYDYTLRRGLRTDTFEYLLAPFTAGPALAEPEHASIVSGFFAFNTIIASRGGFTTPQGVGFLPQALARQVPVEYHAEVTSVEERAGETVVTWTREGQDERQESCDACVLAVPPPHAAALFGQLNDLERAYLTAVEYSRSVHVAFGLERTTRETSLLVQVPRIEHPHLVAYVLEHNQAPDRVPAGKGLVMAHFRGTWSAEHWDLDDSKVVDHALAETTRLGILPELAEHTVLSEVFRVSPCTVIRRPGIYREASRIAASLNGRTRVQFAGGDFLAQSTTNSSLVSGENAARRLLAALRRS
ncbi:FAD-dependent oxidoreductase [Streptomyces sp. NPDC050085]|uniref:FAD-dependent oxidoreductase n=1 Tax=Streptomyces sp. NPDC050085 TaxID=3365600 RepID=UPI00379602D0